MRSLRCTREHPRHQLHWVPHRRWYVWFSKVRAIQTHASYALPIKCMAVFHSLYYYYFEGPPLLLSTLFDLVVPLGGYAIFTAPSVISNPPYSSTAWYNGTAAVQRSGRVTTTSSALTINSVQATDAGIYEYTVTNSYGTTNAYGSLAIGA